MIVYAIHISLVLDLLVSKSLDDKLLNPMRIISSPPLQVSEIP